MDTKIKNYIWVFFMILITAMVAAYILNTAYTPEPEPKYLSSDSYPINCVTVRDNEGNIIFQTGEPVHVEDEFINEENARYIVTSVSGAEGIAEIKQELPDSRPADYSKRVFKTFASDTVFFNDIIPAGAPLKDTHVVIYHTHTDESFVPTSGTASEPGDGDVLDIGKILEESLKTEGVSVTHSEALHDPHDINAYSRSRRTAVQLIKEQPDIVLDIHRDSAPIEAYETTVNGIDSSKIMIVIGRGNPNMQTNLEYAKKVKAAADKLHVGLLRGIFMGKGDYNQDLYPTSILLECGTEQMTQEDVEIAVRSLTDVIVTILRNS